jgi:hypothetical protein
VISIPEVTGDIVITAIASYTNQIPLSTDENGELIGGTGWVNGKRINSSGECIEAPDAIITGFIPVKYNDTIYLKNVNFRKGAEERLGCYDINK